MPSGEFGSSLIDDRHRNDHLTAARPRSVKRATVALSFFGLFFSWCLSFRPTLPAVCLRSGQLPLLRALCIALLSQVFVQSSCIGVLVLDLRRAAYNTSVFDRRWLVKRTFLQLKLDRRPKSFNGLASSSARLVQRLSQSSAIILATGKTCAIEIFRKGDGDSPRSVESLMDRFLN